MSYYFNTTLSETNFEETLETVTNELAKAGFGVVSIIDLAKTFKKKIDIDFKKYTILGACNPSYAHQALLTEDKIGVLLPCNVAVIEQTNGSIEVAAVDPVTSMAPVENTKLAAISQEIQEKLQRVIQGL